MYEKILVPIDGSKRAERVLHHVEKLAIQNNSDVVLLMATPLKGRTPSSHDSQYYLNSFDRQKIAAESYLTAIQSALNQKKVKARGTVEFGNPIEVVEAKVKDENPDLVAIASHGKKSYGPLLNKISTPILFITS